MLAVPVDHVGGGFGDEEVGAFLRELFGDGGDGVAEAESAKPDLRLAGWAKWGAGEAGEFFFRRAGGRAADLLAMNEQRFTAVVFLEGEDVSIGELSFGESNSWFHGAGGWLCWARLTG